MKYKMDPKTGEVTEEGLESVDGYVIGDPIEGHYEKKFVIGKVVGFDHNTGEICMVDEDGKGYKLPKGTYEPKKPHRTKYEKYMDFYRYQMADDRKNEKKPTQIDRACDAIKRLGRQIKEFEMFNVQDPELMGCGVPEDGGFVVPPSKTKMFQEMIEGQRAVTLPAVTVPIPLNKDSHERREPLADIQFNCHMKDDLKEAIRDAVRLHPDGSIYSIKEGVRIDYGKHRSHNINTFSRREGCKKKGGLYYIETSGNRSISYCSECCFADVSFVSSDPVDKQLTVQDVQIGQKFKLNDAKESLIFRMHRIDGEERTMTELDDGRVRKRSGAWLDRPVTIFDEGDEIKVHRGIRKIEWCVFSTKYFARVTKCSDKKCPKCKSERNVWRLALIGPEEGFMYCSGCDHKESVL